MTGETKKLFKNITANANLVEERVAEMAEEYVTAMEFIMENGLYSEFLRFESSKISTREQLINNG